MFGVNNELCPSVTNTSPSGLMFHFYSVFASRYWTWNYWESIGFSQYNIFYIARGNQNIFLIMTKTSWSSIVRDRMRFIAPSLFAVQQRKIFQALFKYKWGNFTIKYYNCFNKDYRRGINIWYLAPIHVKYLQAYSRSTKSQHDIYSVRNTRCDRVHRRAAGDQVRLLPLLLQQLHRGLVDVDGEHHHGARPADQPGHHGPDRGEGPGHLESTEHWRSFRVQTEADPAVGARSHDSQSCHPWDQEHSPWSISRSHVRAPVVYSVWK